MPRNYRKLRGYSALSDCVEKVTKPIFDKRGAVEGKIILKWEEIVGHEIASMANPKKISFSGKTSTLHLDVNSIYIVDVEYIKDVIISKISAHFGYDVISSVKCKQIFNEIADSTDAKLSQKNLAISSKCNMMVDNLVQNEELKKALLSLSNNI